MVRGEKLLRLTAAAERMATTPRALKDWIRRGRIRGVKLDNGHWRVPETEVEKRISQK
jgi:excisionase family DNA binding protein